MKIPHLLATLAVANIFCNSVLAGWFIRPNAGYVFFQNSHYSDQEFAGVVGGVAFGQESSHELGFEYSYFNWRYRDIGNVMHLRGADTSGDGHIQPIVFSYRYYTGLRNSSYRFYFGPSVGFADIRGNLTQQFSGRSPANGHVDDWNTTLSAAVGVQIALTRTASVEVGYRYMQISSTSAELSYYYPPRFEFGIIKAQVLSAGIRVQF